MIYFITGNKGKLAEAKAILGDNKIEGLDIDLPEIQEIDAHEIIKAKLAEAEKHQKGEFIVEDTSLYLDALNDLPGPLIKWFMKTIGNDGLAKIAEKFEDSKAQARTLVGYSDKKGRVEFFEGIIEGDITSPKGTGFGWDPIFQPNGYNKTFGEMDSEEKNKISMRKIAFEKLKKYLMDSESSSE
jgi:non-canonical purine NTP pyrophosphatase (RdgB/HAM1 family)